MEKIKIIVVDGVVETVLSTNPEISVEVVNTSWNKYREELDNTNETMHTAY